MSNFSA